MAASPTILQIIPQLESGGAEICTIQIADAIVRAGGCALVATEGGRLAGEVIAAGGEIVAMPVASKNPAIILANIGRLSRLVRERGISLIDAASRAPAWSGLAAARRTSIPFVTTFHGAYGESNRIKRLYNSVMARGDRVIANSLYTGDLITHRYGTEKTRLRIVPRGVDVARFARSGVAPERMAALRAAWSVNDQQPIILHAARLTNWKGQRVAIEALAALHAKQRLNGAVLVMAGDAQGRDAYASSLRELAATLGVSDHIRLPGHVADMPAAYATADVTLVASIEPEAFGLTAAEAQAAACPVITTNIGAPPEIILAPPHVSPSEATGWHAPPNDAAALAGAIAEALAMDGTARDAMRARAVASVAARFTVAEMQRQTLAVYDSLLGSRLADQFAKGLPQV
jgi:glycosyltransferase involved in cell wall biosynthesis